MFDRPASVLGDEWLWIAGGAIEGGQGGGISDIPQRDADITEQAAAFGAQHRSAGEALFETGIVEREQCDQIRRGKLRSRMRLHQRRFLRELVPRAGSKTIVTTIDAVPDGGAQFDWDAALEFDGQVGNTTTGIEQEGRGDGLRRTRGDAAGAGAATIFLRNIGREFKRGYDFGEEEPVAELAADEIRVLADEAKPGTLGEVAFEEGAGIDVPKAAGVRAAEFVDKAGELPERSGKHVVVIDMPCVAGDEAGF